MYTLRLNVPPGAGSLRLNFQILSPGTGGEFGQSVSATDRIEDLEWNQVVFYPSGYAARSITVRPSVKLPSGWQFGTALKPVDLNRETIGFEPVSLEQLIDSPLIAGINFVRLDLAPGAPANRFIST